MDQKIQWLIDNGYELNFLGDYRFEYQIDNYRAGCVITKSSINFFTLEEIKYRHKGFIELAEQKHDFNKEI